jgi:hypothetical protein
MKKFWEWMKNNNNAYYDGENSLLTIGTSGGFEDIEPTKQMLIGYMIEYLHDIGVIHKTLFNMNIEGVYLYLEDLINEIKELD